MILSSWYFSGAVWDSGLTAKGKVLNHLLSKAYEVVSSDLFPGSIFLFLSHRPKFSHLLSKGFLRFSSVCRNTCFYSSSTVLSFRPWLQYSCVTWWGSICKADSQAWPIHHRYRHRTRSSSLSFYLFFFFLICVFQFLAA